jgi:hypothetical protein
VRLSYFDSAPTATRVLASQGDGSSSTHTLVLQVISSTVSVRQHRDDTERILFASGGAAPTRSVASTAPDSSQTVPLNVWAYVALTYSWKHAQPGNIAALRPENLCPPTQCR